MNAPKLIQRAGMKFAHPMVCASLSRPEGKSGKRRVVLAQPSEVSCDCGAVSPEERLRIAHEIEARLAALRASIGGQP